MLYPTERILRRDPAQASIFSHHEKGSEVGMVQGNLAAWAAGLLLATLPFSGIQLFSIPLPIVMALLSTTVLFPTLLSGRVRVPAFFWIASSLSLTHLYFSLDMFSINNFGQLKSAAYLFYAFSLFNLLCLIRNEKQFNLLCSVVGWGLLFYGAVFLYFSIALGLFYQLFSLNYFRSVLPILVAIANVGDITEFEGRDALRNTVAEALAFSVFFALKSRAWAASALGSMVVFVLQSRRAFAALLVVFLSKLRTRYSLILALLAVPVVALLGSLLDLSTSRYAEWGAGMRGDQLRQAMRMIAEQPLWGWGYGTQVYGAYVHNFFIASFLMSGFIAFALSLILVAHAIWRASHAKRFGVLIVFCIGNMLFAATVEGLLSLSAWASLCFIYWEGEFSKRNMVRI